MVIRGLEHLLRELDADLYLLLLVAYGSAVTVELTLRGRADGVPYERKRHVSIV